MAVDKTKLRIHRLLKKGQDANSLRFVNFKIETDNDIGEMISTPGFWPHHIHIKRWIKKVNSTSPSSFLVKQST